MPALSQFEKDQQQLELESGNFTVGKVLGEKIEDGVKLYHIKWRFFPLRDATWEPADSIGRTEAVQHWNAQRKKRSTKSRSPDARRKREHSSESLTRNSRSRNDVKLESSPSDDAASESGSAVLRCGKIRRKIATDAKSSTRSPPSDSPTPEPVFLAETSSAVQTLLSVPAGTGSALHDPGQDIAASFQPTTTTIWFKNGIAVTQVTQPPGCAVSDVASCSTGVLDSGLSQPKSSRTFPASQARSKSNMSRPAWNSGVVRDARKPPAIMKTMRFLPSSGSNYPLYKRVKKAEPKKESEPTVILSTSPELAAPASSSTTVTDCSSNLLRRPVSAVFSKQTPDLPSSSNSRTYAVSSSYEKLPKKPKLFKLVAKQSDGSRSQAGSSGTMQASRKSRCSTMAVQTDFELDRPLMRLIPASFMKYRDSIQELRKRAGDALAVRGIVPPLGGGSGTYVGDDMMVMLLMRTVLGDAEEIVMYPKGAVKFVFPLLVIKFYEHYCPLPMSSDVTDPSQLGR